MIKKTSLKEKPKIKSKTITKSDKIKAFKALQGLLKQFNPEMADWDIGVQQKRAIMRVTRSNSKKLEDSKVL
jgi:hypothetical protein